MRNRGFLRRGLLENLSVEFTPLVDIMFLLLIFLILTTTFVITEKIIDVQLPKAYTGEEYQNGEKVLTIVITSKGEIFVNGKYTSPDDLMGVIQMIKITEGVERVRILADTNTPYGDVVRMMDLLRTLEITNIELSVSAG
ncbi:MAG: biopolymer transporter ExbD [Thermotogae bacterium]|nr:biopolymer transporter ExbD [Thermotogota bacterium]